MQFTVRLQRYGVLEYGVKRLVIPGPGRLDCKDHGSEVAGELLQARSEDLGDRLGLIAVHPAAKGAQHQVGAAVGGKQAEGAEDAVPHGLLQGEVF